MSNNAEDSTIQKISELIDGTLSETDQAALIELMKTDTHVRAQYLDMVAIDSMLNWNGTNETIDLPRPCSTVTTTSRSGNDSQNLQQQIMALRFSLVGLVLLCAFMGSWLLLRGGSPVEAAGLSELGEGDAIAYLTRVDHVVWEPTRLPTQPGNLLKPGWLKLKSGRIEIDFLDGTRAILEGPAELGITAKNRTFLKSGTMIVQTSSTGKFFIETPAHLSRTVEIQNGHLGIRAQDGQSEYHLFSGQAKISNLKTQTELKLLKPNEAVVINEMHQPATMITKRIDPKIFPAFQTEVDSPAVPVINFQSLNVQPYGYQDGQHDLNTEYAVSKSGNEISLSGNSWKMIEINAVITKETVLEFEFRSDFQGEIHGFGFDTDNEFESSKETLFQIYGYEIRKGIGQQFNNYHGSEWKTYQIRVGHYVSGAKRFLYFVADDDVTARAKSQFRNVKLFQAKIR